MEINTHAHQEGCKVGYMLVGEDIYAGVYDKADNWKREACFQLEKGGLGKGGGAGKDIPNTINGKRILAKSDENPRIRSMAAPVTLGAIHREQISPPLL